MADTKDLEVSPPPEVESPADFLKKLAVALREAEGVDIELAEILGKHLLTAAPAPDAVALAKAAILKLAADRANPATSEAGYA